MSDIIHKIREQLIASVDEKTQMNSQRFFKEKIFDLCEELWQSGNLEESFVACNWTYALWKDFKPYDFKRFKKWIGSYVNNWASCDTFCNHSVGEFLELYPDYLSELKTFTTSKNRWMRRASAVSLIIPARKGI